MGYKPPVNMANMKNYGFVPRPGSSNTDKSHDSTNDFLGGKNLQKLLKTQTLYIATFTRRTVTTEDGIVQLEDELTQVK